MISIFKTVSTVLYSSCLKNTFATVGLINLRIVGVNIRVLQLVPFFATCFFCFETTYFEHNCKQQFNEDFFENEHMVLVYLTKFKNSTIFQFSIMLKNSFMSAFCCIFVGFVCFGN